MTLKEYNLIKIELQEILKNIKCNSFPIVGVINIFNYLDDKNETLRKKIA
jgi:hypothetical protein